MASVLPLLSSQQIEWLFETTGYGLLILDEIGRVRAASGLALSILGQDSSACGRLLTELVAGAEPMLRKARPGEQMRAQLTLPSGEKRTVAFTPFEQFAHGMRLVVLRDIGHLISLDNRLQRAQKMAQVGELASKLSHEIKNPLAGVLAGLRLLERENAVAVDHRAVLDGIADKVRSACCILDGLLGTAKPSPIRPEPITVARLVYDGLMPYLELATSRGVELNFEAGPADTHIVVDAPEFRRVLGNLLLNAIDAATSGGHVVIGWAQLDAKEVEKRLPGFSGNVARIYVTDDGPGIAPELLEVVFTPFFTTKPGGTGLGLAVAREIVEAHGGVLSARASARGAELEVLMVCGDRPHCWEGVSDCLADCNTCVARDTPRGYCCWAAAGQAAHAETGRSALACLTCRYYLSYALTPYHQRQPAERPG